MYRALEVELLKLLGGRDCKEMQYSQFNVWRAVQFPMPAKWGSQLADALRELQIVKQVNPSVRALDRFGTSQ